MLAEVLLIVVVYVVGVLIVWRNYMALDTATWYATPSVEGLKLRLSGMWYGYVSLPMFQFLLRRWYFRFFIWSRFLWHGNSFQVYANGTVNHQPRSFWALRARRARGCATGTTDR
jgi:hypothetical protein